MTKTTAGRLLAVGDIHGQNAKLQALLQRVAPTHADRLIFLGDYIDRGPDSFGVIETLLALKERLPQTIFLRGNHECMLMDYLQGINAGLYLHNGGQATLDSYQKHKQPLLPTLHKAFFLELRPYFETDAFIFVHAGLKPHRSLQRQFDTDLYWIREEFLRSDYSWGKTVVFGHTPQKEPLVTAERIGLDTGAAYGRKLTCCDVNRRTFWAI